MSKSNSYDLMPQPVKDLVLQAKTTLVGEDHPETFIEMMRAFSVDPEAIADRIMSLGGFRTYAAQLEIGELVGSVETADKELNSTWVVVCFHLAKKYIEGLKKSDNPAIQQVVSETSEGVLDYLEALAFGPKVRAPS